MDLPAPARNFIQCLEAESRTKVPYSFHFVAFRQADELFLLRGRVRSDSLPEVIGVQPFLDDKVVAGSYYLTDLSLNIEEFIAALISSGVETPVGIIQLRPHDLGTHSITFAPEDERSGPQRRWHSLTIAGQSPKVSVSGIEWHLRGGPKPFAGIRDLMDTYGLLMPDGQFGVCEIVSENVVVIAADSTISTGRAEVGILCGNYIESDDVSVSFIVYHNNRVTDRFSLKGSEFRWEDGQAFRRGRASFGVPVPSVVMCTACFKGAAQHFYWIDDAQHTLNDRRSAYTLLDEDAHFLRSVLLKDSLRIDGRDGRDFEQVVSWLFWMLGFSVAAFGAVDKSEFKDWADLLAVVPGTKDYLVIECTTGSLKPDNKGSNVLRRASQLRAKLASSSADNGRVIPLMVSNRPLSELKTEIKRLSESGVAVLAREDLLSLLDRTMLVVSPLDLFNSLAASVDAQD